MANEFLIRIRADDAATATIKKIEAAFAKITTPIDKAQGRLNNLGNIGQAGLDKIHTGLSKASTAARSMADSIASLVPGMAAIAGMASLAGIAGLAGKFADVGFNISKTSAMIGENRQSLQEWTIAGKRAHISAEEVASGINGMNMAIRGAASGSNGDAARYLQKIGVEIAKNKDGTVDYEKTRQRAMDAIARQKTPQAQQDVAAALGASSLLPMLQRGTYNQDRIDARNSGLTQSEDALNRAQKMQERIDHLKEAIDSLSLSIGDRLSPVLMPVVEAMSRWFDANKEKIANGIANAVAKFSDWLEKIDWDKVGAKVEYFWDKIGGVNGVLIGLAAITFAGPIAGLLSIVTSLAQIGTMLGGAAISTFFGLPAAAAIGTGAAVVAGAAAAGYIAFDMARSSDKAYHDANPDAQSRSLKGGRTILTPGASSGYGWRTLRGKREFHNGIDYPAPEGTPIYATRGGRVVKSGDSNNGYGNSVEIDHGDGTTSRYAHASKTEVALDQLVTAGQEIAKVGSTGRSTGNHVHYELLKNGASVDPGWSSDSKQAQTNPLINIHITAPPGTRAEAKSADGTHVPAKVNHAMGNGGW